MLLRSDNEHGNRGGGPLHQLATEDVAGFMSAADKSYLDQIVGGESLVYATISTTDATETTLASVAIADDTKVRISGIVIGVKSDKTDWASYSFVGLFSATGGVATRDSFVVTEEFESSAAWNLVIDADGDDGRIRVVGDVATEIDWALVDYKITVRS